MLIEGFLMLTQLLPELRGQQMNLCYSFCLWKEIAQNPVPSPIAVVNHVKVDSSLF